MRISKLPVFCGIGKTKQYKGGTVVLDANRAGIGIGAGAGAAKGEEGGTGMFVKISDVMELLGKEWVIDAESVVDAATLAEEVLRLTDVAFNSGFDAGMADGKKSGYEEGKHDGYADGHYHGYDEGYTNGRAS